MRSLFTTLFYLAFLFGICPYSFSDGNQTKVATKTGVWQVSYNGENRPVRWQCGDKMESEGCTYVYALDGNKNISEVVDGNGDVVAHYEYAAFGRIASITSGTNTFTYSYLPGTDIVDGYTCGNFSRKIEFEPLRNLVAAVTNSYANRVISAFDYTNDAAGRCTAISRSGEAFGDLSGATDFYGYNSRNEVISARRTKSGEIIHGFNEDFEYDPIGNRIWSTTYNELGEPKTSQYLANNLNQYTSRTIPGYAAVRGHADADATITVNEKPTYRYGEYFFGSDEFDNTSSPVNATLETVAVMPGASDDDPDEIASVTNSVYLAKSPVEYEYDDDGNQTLVTTKTGTWRVTYNGENRPVRWERLNSSTPNSNTPSLITMTFDHQGRRREYLEVAVNGSTNRHNHFTYDNYLQIANCNLQHATGNLQLFVWDPTEPVATRPLVFYQPNAPPQFYAHDGNKNVSELVSVNNGTITAHYEYSSFGEVILSSGGLALINPFRFSSEYSDDALGLVYYNYRHYDQITGRWIIRDIVDLMSDWPEYGVGLGNMISHHDCLGLFLDELYALDDILSFGVSALRNKSEIILSPDLIELVAADPAMVAFDNELVEKAVQLVVEKLYPLRRREKTFRHLQFSEKPRLISFGGERAKANMIDQLKGFWKSEYRATWRVAGNPLTWMIRNTHVESDVDIYVVFDCGGYEGLVAAEHKIDDILDLRPRRHSKTDLALLLRPSSDPYDAVTMILGFIWHDMLRRRDDLHVKANWIQATIIGNGW